MNEEDISSKLLLQAIKSSMGEDFSFSLLDVLDKKPYEWKLSFDPSSALKAFSWSYSREHHTILCTIYAICCFRKMAPNLIEASLLSDIATTIQMPDTFPPDSMNRTVHQNKVLLSDDRFKKVLKIFSNYIDNNVKDTKHTAELCQYIRTSLQLMKVTGE